MAITIIGAMQFGRMWCVMIRQDGTPSALAASTYTFSFTVIAAPRITREAYAMSPMPSAMMTRIIPHHSAEMPPIGELVGSMITTTIISNSQGIESHASVMRWKKRSKAPPT